MERRPLTQEELSDLKNAYEMIDRTVQSKEPQSITINVNSNNSSTTNSHNINISGDGLAYADATTAKEKYMRSMFTESLKRDSYRSEPRSYAPRSADFLATDSSKILVPRTAPSFRPSPA